MLEHPHRRLIHAGDRLLVARVELGDERLDQQRQVFLALAQRRQSEREDVQPVVEIFAQLALLHRRRRIDVGGGDHAHVDRLLGAPAQPPETAFLEDAEQLHLRRRRHLADLVEEQGAAIRQLETPLPPIRRAGEGALLVTEDFALEQRLGNRGAVDRDERKAGARAQLMDGLRDELLAGARFAGDEHRRRGRRGLLDHLVDLAHLGAVADERAERAVLAQLAAQRLHLAHRFEPLDDLVEQDLQTLNVDRFGQVVVGAFLHRLDRGVDGALRGEQQRRDIGADLRQGAQQREPIHARHHHVGNHDRRTERRDLLERFFAVARRFRDEAPAPDELLEPHARGAVVLDNQHALGYDLRFGFDDIGSSRCNHRLSALNHVIFTFWASNARDAS